MSKKRYELWFGHSTSVKQFRSFRRKCYIKRDGDIGKLDCRSDEGMFLGYSLKRKAYRCFKYRTNTIVECKNVRIDENICTKENMVDYNSDDEEDNSRIFRQNAKIFFETSNDLQNDVLYVEHREEMRFVPRDEIRFEMTTPTSNKNIKKNHPPKKIIGSKDKGVMKRNRVNEELCLIYQVELKGVDEAYKDDHWIQEMKEGLDQI